MKNGSIEFVAVMAEKFKCYVEPYVYYEFNKDYEDHGFSSEVISSRVRSKNSGTLQGQRKAQKRKGRCKEAENENRGRG